MQGRLETELKQNHQAEEILKTLPDYVSNFYYNIHVVNSPLTCVNYIRHIRTFLNYAGTDLNKIDDTTVARFFSEIRYRKDAKGNIIKSSESLSKVMWTVLNQFFEYLYKRGDIEKNPVKLIKRPRKADHIERQFLSMKDLNKILGAVYKLGEPLADRDYAILYLFMTTGMRKTALIEMNLDSLDFENKTITVIDKRDKLQVYEMTGEMEKVFRKWLIHRKRILKDDETDALFITFHKRRLDGKDIYRMVMKYSEEALGTGVSPHKLRAAFVSNFYKASGYDIEATRQAVGHASISTTSIYITRANNPRKDAVNFMEKNLRKTDE